MSTCVERETTIKPSLSAGSWCEDTREAATGPTSTVATIMVVDDEAVTRARLRRTLEQAGYRVIEAEDGRDCLRITSEQAADLILLDMQMPRCDGFKTIRLLRQLFDLSTLPVVMMTSSDGSDQVIAAFENGANDYVRKPCDQAVLLARLRTQLSVRQAQKQLKESETRYALAARGTNDGLWDWNLVSGELHLSPRWRAMVGRGDADWNPRGAAWMELVHPEDRQRVASDLEAHLCGDTQQFETELRMLHGETEYRWMLCRGLAVRDRKGAAYRIAGSLTDITEGKVADALTGLPNRILFFDRVERCLEQVSKRSNREFALIYIDVNEFKSINDRFGHEAGDQFLKDFSQRLEASVRKSDTMIARLGGDEFVVLIDNVRGIDDAVSVAERVQEKLQTTFVIDDSEILVRVSMGIVLSSSTMDGENSVRTPELLLNQADAAMYHAKSLTDRMHCVFEPRMLEQARARLELASDLRTALDQNEISLVYQPIVDITRGRTDGFEALVRWYHPKHGHVPPTVFIPLAESNGWIVEIGKHVLRTACKQAARWRKEFQRDVRISVNVSIRQLIADGFRDFVVEQLNESELPAELLKLEVTESLLMKSPDATIAVLDDFRTLGIAIAIDDFGTGYSSLSYLHQMPLDVLKVDRSFVWKMADSPKHTSIVKTVLALAENLDLSVVAEGVETIAQLEGLRQLGCRYIQGYYFSKPLPSVEASALVDRDWNSICPRP